MIVEMLVVIALVGLLVWALITYVPMPKPFHALIIILAVLIVLVKYVLPILHIKLP